MKLGIISPSHDAAGIKYVHNFGLQYAEFDVNADDINYIKTNKNEILSAMEQYDVKLGAVGRWGRPRIMTDGSFNKKEQQDEFDLIDFCAEAGCPVYICGINYVGDLSYYANITAAIGYIQSLIDYAAGRVKLSVYNCSWNNYIDKPEEWRLVHGHIKGLGIKFDPSHSINGGRNYLDEINKFGKLVDHIHIKGTINIGGERIDDPPAGLDMINWGAFLSIFRKHGYDGMLSIEPHSQTWQGELGENGVKYTINYMKQLLFID